VVAQKAATMGVLSNGRFLLGLGAGENLNEHIAGAWPPVNVRHEMLAEAVDIISALFDGGYVSFSGEHFRVDSAKLWDLPDERVPIGVAVSGAQGIELFAPVADHLIAVEPDADLIARWEGIRNGEPSRKIGQLPICWAPDREEAVRITHEQFRWFGGGWKVNAELPGPTAFDRATQFVRPEDVASSIPCGPDLDPVVHAVQEYADAGFTDVALVQIGDQHQRDFLDLAGKELLATLHAELRPADGPA
jgi:G6PDH family F420-dependent oxidoreductase